jgi:hypothetical protein
VINFLRKQTVKYFNINRLFIVGGFTTIESVLIYLKRKKTIIEANNMCANLANPSLENNIERKTVNAGANGQALKITRKRSLKRGSFISSLMIFDFS